MSFSKLKDNKTLIIKNNNNKKLFKREINFFLSYE